MEDSENCLIENCNISFLLAYMPYYSLGADYVSKAGIVIRGDNNEIRNCNIVNSWGSAIVVRESASVGNKIINNSIKSVNWMGGYMASIEAGGTNTIIQNNTLAGSGRFLIRGTGIKKGAIKNNEMSMGMMLGQDGGAFYTCNVPSPAQGDSTEIAYNWIHDMIGSDWIYSPGNPASNRKGTSGIYLDCASSGFFLHHNVIWNAEKGIQVNRIEDPDSPDVLAKENYIYHNTCMVNQEADYAIKVANFDLTHTGDNDSSNVRVYNNLVNNFILEMAELRGNLVHTSTTFASTHFIAGNSAGSNKDFKLKTSSPAVDYENSINIFIDGTTTLLFDTVGSGPDAGAYEKGGEFWVAGHSGSIGVQGTGGSRLASQTALEDNKSSFTKKNKSLIYPNPSEGIIRVSLPNEEQQAQLLIIKDFQGKETFRSNFNQYETTDLDLTHLPTGLYLWQLINESGEVQSSGKLIKK